MRHVLTEPRIRIRQQRQRCERRDTYYHAASQRPPLHRHLLLGATQLAHDQPRVLQKRFTHARECDAIHAAPEQRDSEVGFQFTNGLGDGRLTDEQRPRRTDHSAVIGHGHERAKLMKLEGHYYLRVNTITNGYCDKTLSCF